MKAIQIVIKRAILESQLTIVWLPPLNRARILEIKKICSSVFVKKSDKKSFGLFTCSISAQFV
jgi:hypothetical protein